MKYTDKELLDFLQRKNDEKAHGGLCMLRDSDYGRGWRLHETKRVGAIRDVRRAIGIVVDREKRRKKCVKEAT